MSEPESPRVSFVLAPKQRIAITIGDQFVIRIQLVDVFYGNNLMLHESRRRNMTTLDFIERKSDNRFSIALRKESH